ncbi:MAG: hypothetical protein ACOCZ5_01645 [bacterium]
MAGTDKNKIIDDSIEYIEGRPNTMGATFCNKFKSLSYENKKRFVKELISSQGRSIIKHSKLKRDISIAKIGVFDYNEAKAELNKRIEGKDVPLEERKRLSKELILKSKSNKKSIPAVLSFKKTEKK